LTDPLVPTVVPTEPVWGGGVLECDECETLLPEGHWYEFPKRWYEFPKRWNERTGPLLCETHARQRMSGADVPGPESFIRRHL
jgi:hypothetical protein